MAQHWRHDEIPLFIGSGPSLICPNNFYVRSEFVAQYMLIHYDESFVLTSCLHDLSRTHEGYDLIFGICSCTMAYLYFLQNYMHNYL